MKLNYKLTIIFFILSILKLQGQVNPIWPLANGNNQINCTFSEIHGSGVNEHIHGAIDIQCNTNTKFKAILDGRVINNANGNINIFETGHDYQNPDKISYLKKIRYGDTTDNLPNIDNSAIITQNENIGIMTSRKMAHLHFEMYIRDAVESPWRRVDPLGNPEANYEEDIPNENDTTHTEINDIILQPAALPSGIMSGCFTLNNGGGIFNNLPNCLRLHIKKRPGSGNEQVYYNISSDKIILYGSLGTILHARDPRVTTDTAGSGMGLGIYEAIFKIDNIDKYHIKFDEINDLDIHHTTSFYHTEFNTLTDKKYGNNDYLEMRRIDSNEGSYYPHKLVTGVQSNGVWATRARIGTSIVFQNTPTLLARGNAEALYGDGTHLLSYTVSDAAGNHSDATVSIILDNFKPYVQSVEMKVGNQTFYKKSWEWESCGGVKFTSQIDTTYELSTLQSSGMTITAYSSEPLNEMKLSIPFYNLSNLTGTPTDTTNKKFIFNTGAVTTFNLAATRELIFKGKDYRNNPIIALEGFVTNPCVVLPVRSGVSSWINPLNIPLNETTNNGDKTYKLPCTNIHFSSTVFITDPTGCGDQDGSLCSKSVTTTGGFPDYHYHWEDEFGNILPPGFCGPINLDPGNYYFIAKDSVGCLAKIEYSLVSPHYPDVLDYVQPTCTGINIGSIELLAFGSTTYSETYDFHWSTGKVTHHSDTSGIYNLAAGHYCATITSNIGNCTIIKCYDVGTLNGAPPVIMDISTVQPCHNQNNGEILISATTSLPPIKFNWGGGYEDAYGKFNLSEGTHCISIKDYCNHVIDTCINLQSLSGYITEIPGCNRGYITANGINGNPPYSYKWLNSSISGNNQTVGPIWDGHYWVSISDSKACVKLLDDNLVNTTMTFDTVRPCAGFNDGSITVKISNPYQKHGLLTVNISDIFIETYDIPEGQAQFNAYLTSLHGDNSKTYKFKVEIDSCILEDEFKLEDEILKDSFLQVNRDTCFYYQYCKGIKVTPPGGFEKILINIHPLESDYSTFLGFNSTCTTAAYCKDKKIGDRAYPPITWPVGMFEDLISKLRNNQSVYPDWYLNELQQFVADKGQCDNVTFCPISLKTISKSSNLFSWFSLFTGGSSDGDVVYLDNNCRRIECPGFGNNYTLCKDQFYPIVAPTIKFDSSFHNCEPRTYNVYQLIVWHQQLLTSYSNFAGSELDSFLTFHQNDKAAHCATVRICKNDFSIQNTDIDQIDCDPFPNEYPEYEPCGIDSTENTCASYLYSYIIHCRCKNKAWSDDNCETRVPIYLKFDRGFYYINTNHPEVFVTHITETQRDQDFIDFGYNRFDGITVPKPIFRTADGYQFYDYLFSGTNIITRPTPSLKALFLEIDTFKSIDVIEVVTNKEFQFNEVIDTNIYTLRIRSSDYLSIEKVFRNGENTKIIGKFNGILYLGATQMCSSRQDNIFYLEIDNDGNVYQFHLIDNVRANTRTSISNEMDGVQIDGYVKSQKVFLDNNQLSTGTIDSSFHVRINDLGIAISTKAFIKTGSIYLAKSAYDKINKVTAMLYGGSGTIQMGTLNYSLSGTSFLLAGLDSLNNLIWRKEISASGIIEGKYDFIYNENGELIIGLTNNRNFTIDGIEYINYGGEDINF